MTYYDMAMAAVLIAGMIRGAWRGITWQLASIGSLVLGYLFSYQVSAAIAPMLPGTPEAARAMSMAGSYLVVSGAVFGLAWMVRNVIRKLRFDAYDRHLGMMLGGVEGAAVGILATMLVVSVAPGTRQPIFASPTGKVVNSLVSNVGPILPGEVRNALAPYWPGAVAAAESEAAPEPEARDQAVASRASARLDAAVGPRREGDADNYTATAAPASTRDVVDRLVEQGRGKAEQALVETLDPDGKASTIRDLFEKDKGRLKEAVAGAVDETRRNLADQIQDPDGKVQGKAGEVAKRLGKYRDRIARVQDDVKKARQRLEQGTDGTIEDSRRKLEKSLSDAIDKGLDKLGLPDPAPAAAPR
ncbi:CvpA family protein [Paludisphaera mucosa]|uniref:CvpA family protein n=1 Tax=Paludisphaera mucosa TaxID=3030827 RepID=A0ABT6FB20_9BACT|nr:CvpA family protein [Paludisphaera mucosa]MDG3004788.1 CvpA family protein [Paludisphaera mucosa]